jgi:hypothetical protein
MAIGYGYGYGYGYSKPPGKLSCAADLQGEVLRWHLERGVER